MLTFEIPACSAGQPGTGLPCVKLNDLFEGLSTGFSQGWRLFSSASVLESFEKLRRN